MDFPQSIGHNVTSVDCHPMFDGGILVNVMGQLKTDQVMRMGLVKFIISYDAYYLHYLITVIQKFYMNTEVI